MKTRESGMPDEGQWESFFDPETVLDRLRLSRGIVTVVEFGCGYGTFSIPAARRATGLVHALEVDPQMASLVGAKAQFAGQSNISVHLRDFVADGTGLADGEADYVMLFNILHAENPQVMLNEAWRILAPRGILGIMHWNYDANTPRGPSMNIRPRPEQCRDWALAAGFRLLEPGIVDLPPFHYGMALEKAV